MVEETTEKPLPPLSSLAAHYSALLDSVRERRSTHLLGNVPSHELSIHEVEEYWRRMGLAHSFPTTSASGFAVRQLEHELFRWLSRCVHSAQQVAFLESEEAFQRTQMGHCELQEWVRFLTEEATSRFDVHELLCISIEDDVSVSADIKVSAGEELLRLQQNAQVVAERCASELQESERVVERYVVARSLAKWRLVQQRLRCMLPVRSNHSQDGSLASALLSHVLLTDARAKALQEVEALAKHRMSLSTAQTTTKSWETEGDCVVAEYERTQMNGRIPFLLFLALWCMWVGQ